MPYIVPGPTPGTPGWGDYLGQGFASGVNRSTDLLLKALLEGQLVQMPKQGSYTAPSGATTALSPAEVSAQNPTVNLSQLLQRSGATQRPGVQFHPAGFPLTFQPSLDRQYKQSEIAKNQAQTKMYGQVGNVSMMTLPDGTQIPMLASTSGPKPLQTGAEAKSRHAEQAYEFHSNAIDRERKPVEERLDRLSRLQDTMNEMTPQADALLAPELLTVMAGGQGSGLRMNEAEIARIVGGRTVWESLKAKLNKFHTDPAQGLSVTPAQRQQMRSLVSTVQQKLLAKREILNQAQQDMLEMTDPKEYRQAMLQMRQALQQVDGMGNLSNQQGSGQVNPSGISEGQTIRNPKTGARMVFRGGQWQAVMP